MLDNLIAFDNPKSRAAEAFRTLRTNIQFSTFDDTLKTIVITSTMPSEGKSTIISNLAFTMAQSGKKVLLIDCDLRKPTVHKKMGVSNEDGLTSMLTGNKKFEECVATTKQNNLFILPSGPVPPNPSELLGSKKMRALIKEMEAVFDLILLDAPPVIVVTDAQVLSRISSGVIIVASYGQTEKAALIKAKDLLNKVDAKILGVVINKIPEKSEGYHYGKYYSGYYEDDKK